MAIIDKYFNESMVIDQDILGNERLDKFLNIIDQDLRGIFKDILEKYETSEERWKAFEDTFIDLMRKVSNWFNLWYFN